MRRMAGPPAVAAKIQIPRWIQLVGLPLVLLFLWTVAGAARHVIFLFLVAALIAFLLNPIVRGLTRVWIPRGFGSHAARHAAAAEVVRPALPSRAGRPAAARPDRARAGELRTRPGAALADHRHERRARPLAARYARLGAGGGQVRGAVRRVG